MKTLKKLKTVLLIAVIFVLAGCSDQISSLEEKSLISPDIENSATAGSQIYKSLFKDRVILKPNRTSTYNIAKTGLASIYSVDVKRIYPESNDDFDRDPCKGIEVTGNGTDEINLGCAGINLNVKEVTVRNTTSEIVDLEVIIYGTKFEKHSKVR